MVNQTAIAANDVIMNDECPRELAEAETTPVIEGEMEWSRSSQGIILGSYFWGYVLTQIPGGWLAERWSGKTVKELGVGLGGILSLLTPAAARSGVACLCLVRFLIGLSHGVTMAAAQVLITKWAPPMERTQITAVAVLGCELGCIIGWPLTGFLCDSQWTGGWPSAFYVIGSMTLVWWLLWSILVSKSPEDCSLVTEEERIYISKSLSHSTSSDGIDYTPWVDIFTSLPVWSIVVCHTAFCWGFHLLLTDLPQYLNDILHFNVRDNGLLSTLPYVGFVITGLTCSFTADLLRRRDWLSTTAVRKLASWITMLGPGGFLLAAGYSGCNRVLAVSFIVLAVMSSSFVLCCAFVNHMDLSPRYVGVLVGITNTAATVPGILAPYVVGYLTDRNPTRGQWLIVFYMTAVLGVFGGVFYQVFGTGEEQGWNQRGERTQELRDERLAGNDYGALQRDARLKNDQ